MISRSLERHEMKWLRNFELLLIFSFRFNPSRPDPGRREKINRNFYFSLPCGASKGFMKALT